MNPDLEVLSRDLADQAIAAGCTGVAVLILNQGGEGCHAMRAASPDAAAALIKMCDEAKGEIDARMPKVPEPVVVIPNSARH